MSGDLRFPYRQGVLAGAIALTVVVCLFAEALSGDRIFAFRDATHTFPPLYRLVCDEWLAGRAPLWNPLLNGGQPLAGSGITGAFYPPQILLAAILPDGLSLVVLVVGHLVVAGLAAGLIARDAGCSIPAAALAGLTYAGCGAVVLQVYNPIMVAGAAWFAVSIRFGLHVIRRCTVGNVLALAISLALAVLSGDPQAAYHAGIALGIFVVWRAWRHSDGGVTEGPQTVATSGIGLLAAAAIAAALALPQISESSAFLRTTTRFTDAFPLSIWDVQRHLADSSAAGERSPPEATWYDVIIGRPPESVSFYHEIYRFSVMPWQLVELFSPTLCGPFMRRWTLDAGFERDAWTATLYAGALPLACVVAAIWRRDDPRRSRWLMLLVIASLACLGGFGIVGLARHAVARVAGDTAPAPYLPGDEVGGLYWAMVTILPGYSGFRYPAKWLTPCALAFAQLAAFGFDDLMAGFARSHVRRSLIVIPIVSLLGTAVALASAPASDALSILAGGGLVGACSLAAVGTCRRAIDQSPRSPWLLVAVAAIDLVIGGRLNLAVCRFSSITDGTRILETVSAARLPACRDAGGRPRLVVIDALMPDPDPVDLEAWGRSVGTMMRGNIPMLGGWGKFGEPGTAMEADTELLASPLDPRRIAGFARRVFDTSSVEFFVLPGDDDGLALGEFQRDWSSRQRAGELHGSMPEGPPMPVFPAAGPAGGDSMPVARFIRNESALPRVRITRNLRRIDPLPPTPRNRHVASLAAIAFPNPTVPWLGDMAIVESATELPSLHQVREDVGDESCRIVVDESRRVVVEATLRTPALVVLADAFHPDWRLEVTSDGQPAVAREIVRANRIQRGCLLPAGRHMLDYRHRSPRFEHAAILSGMTWLCVAIGVSVAGIRGRWR